MSSRKRPRDIGNLNDESGTESASPNFRQTPQKRSRVALAAQNGGSVVSDEDDSDINDALQDDDRGDFLSSPAHSSEDDDEQEVDDDYDMLVATKVLQKKLNGALNNTPSDQGIIEEVFCRNFMCHSRLRIKLGPLINFIIGHNGSGKSAVLTALQMCLGGKATATNRGANLKSLIKEGEESATLAVKIKNQGEGAYKPDLYGHSIIVERHFNRSGTSGFKIKNAEEKVITTKRADLDDILDFFALQLDNPMNVLTQDLARQFLANSSPSEKYKFFIRGTQLEALDGDYKILEDHLNNMEEKLAQREEDVRILADRAKDADKRKKQLDDIAHVQARIDETSRMHAWAQVEEQEGVLENMKGDVVLAEQQVHEHEQAAETVVGTYEGHDQAFESAKRNLETLSGQLRPLSDNASGEREKFESMVKELKNTKAEQRRIKENMDKCKRNIDKLNADVTGERQRLSEAEGGAHAERLNHLEELKMVHRAAKEAEADHIRSKPELTVARDHASERAVRADAEQAEAKERLNRAVMSLSRTEQDQGGKYTGFPARIEDLIREIDREKRWRVKPLGPVGIHVRLLAPEWSSQIERMLGSTLNAFLVTCKEDQNILSAIMKRVGFQTTIYMGNPNPLNTSDKEPEADVKTVMRVLRIDNDFVRNTLVTNHVIEQTVLIKDPNKAYEYLYENPRGRPRNVRAVIAMASKQGAGIRYEYTAKGEKKTSTVKPWTGQVRMKTDREQQLNLQRERAQQSKQEADNADQEARRCAIELQKAKQAIARFDRESNNLRQRTQQAEEQVDITQNEIESNQPQHGRLQELERQLEQAQSELKEEEASYQDSVLAMDKTGQISRELKVAFETAQAELDKAQKNRERAEVRQQKLEQVRNRALYEKNEALARVDTSKEHVTRLQGKCDTQQARVSEFIGEAGKICARVPVEEGVTPQILDERLQRFIEDRERRERTAGGTREELTAAWNAAELLYREANSQLKSLTAVAHALRKSLVERRRRWNHFRKYISVRARSNFSYLLSERRFRGGVEINHADRLLEISVEPDSSKADDKGRQARTLSGGEKSFSTICLLLSIWEAMGSPIRCLDEFDVFMDSVNRSTSMSLMIQAARRAVGRQFILITPQAMNQVALGDDVRIHRMSDPERGQTTLTIGAR